MSIEEKQTLDELLAEVTALKKKRNDMLQESKKLIREFGSLNLINTFGGRISKMDDTLFLIKLKQQEHIKNNPTQPADDLEKRRKIIEICG